MSQDVVRRNNVRIFGTGERTIVFAHGFGCDQNLWRFVAPAFADDLRVVLFDYVGSGRSDLAAYDAERYSRLDGYADDVLEICRALDLRDVVFVGHSVSSMIGVLAANREPERFHRLVLVSPSPRYLNELPEYVGGFEHDELEELFEMMDRNYLGWASVMGATVMGNPDRPELGRELTESFCSTDPVIARRFAQATFFGDNRADLAQVRVPALVIQCADDLIAPRKVGEYVHRHLPRSTLRILPVSGHCPHVSAPEATIRAIREYLASDSDSNG